MDAAINKPELFPTEITNGRTKSGGQKMSSSRCESLEKIALELALWGVKGELTLEVPFNFLAALKLEIEAQKRYSPAPLEGFYQFAVLFETSHDICFRLLERTEWMIANE